MLKSNIMPLGIMVQLKHVALKGELAQLIQGRNNEWSNTCTLIWGMSASFDTVMQLT